MLIERLEAGMSDEEALDWNIPIPPTGPTAPQPITLDEENRRERIVDDVLDSLRLLPGITFMAEVFNGSGGNLVSGPYLPGIVELVFHYCRGIEVDGGRLARPADDETLQDNRSYGEEADRVRSYIAQLDAESIDYVVVWHVTGETQVRLDTSYSDDCDLMDGIIRALNDEVSWGIV